MLLDMSELILQIDVTKGGHRAHYIERIVCIVRLRSRLREILKAT